METWKEKEIVKKHNSHDINGNPVYKLFYMDGTTEIVKTYELSGFDKYYKSLSGLRNSK
jgi:hypothetical protein